MTDAERIVKDATAELADAADETLGVRADDLRAEILGVFDRLAREHAALLRWADEARAEIETARDCCARPSGTCGSFDDLLAALDAVTGGHQ